jgi:hypothetical protein
MAPARARDAGQDAFLSAATSFSAPQGRWILVGVEPPICRKETAYPSGGATRPGLQVSVQSMGDACKWLPMRSMWDKAEIG